MENKGKIATRLREVRKNRGCTQESVAKDLGISRSTVASWETGVRVPSAKELLEYCKIFGVSFDYMCGRTDNAAIKKKPSAYEIDWAKLNPLGQQFLYEFYHFLSQNDTYKRQ